MKAVYSHSGFTILETVLATAVSGILISALLSFYLPSVKVYKDVLQSTEEDNHLTSALQNIQQEASNQSAVYVDDTQCYALCMVDPNGYRTYYYWNGTGDRRTLYRKREPTTNAISCSGGHVFASNIDHSKSSFAMNNSLLTVKLAETGVLTSTILPALQERSIIFSEGFECNTLRAGWVVTTGSGSSWAIQSNSTQGTYQITDTGTGNGASTTTIEAPIDLARTSSAHLKFNYMNDGTITSPDSFTVSFYDGATYQTVYTDSSAQLILNSKTIEADLTGYTLGNNNRIRFTATLSHPGAHWYVDSISVFTP